MSEYKTTWEDDNGAEFEVIVHYDYQPKEEPTLEYPGCEESVTITNVKIFEYQMDKYGTIGKYWSDAWDETLDHHAKWSEEILESINNLGEEE